MKNKYLIWASLAVAALLSAGCVKEKNYDEIRVPGEPIRFAAETGFENGDGTRTEYSGILSGTTTVYERIDWVSNDPMKIIYVQGNAESFANYKVESFSSSEEPNSYAQVSVDGSDELVWGAGSGTNKFYAMYPTTARNPYASLVKTGSDVRATGTLLPTQDVDASKTQTISVNGDSWTRYQPNMDYNYLLAYADDNTGINGGSVRLPFRPAVTAFEFRFQLQSGDVVRKVTKFELSSSSCALTGEFKIDITGGNDKGATWGSPIVPSRTSANSVITVNFPAGGVALPSEGYLDFTVFALPSELTDLTMTLTYEGGKHAVLPLNVKTTGAAYQFAGARKYIITNSNVPGTQVWHYVIEEIEDQTFVGHTPVYPIGYNVKSYKWSDREGQGVKYPVAWKTQYSMDGGTTWTDVPSTGAITGSDYSVESGAVTGSGVGTSAYATGEAREARLSGSTSPDSGSYGPSAQDIIDDLASRTAKTDFDLSMHDVFGTPHAQTTANSYVVTTPGTYKFPVVYGNAITNGRDNVEAYFPMIDGTDVGAPGVVSQLFATVYAPHRNEGTFRYLGRFRSADNDPISKPDIVEDFEFWESETVKYGGPAGQYTPSNLEAVIVWQNSMELPGETVGHPIIQETSVSYDPATHYISFTVDPNDIRPGNAVIALRGKVGNKLPAGTILWSWQIWVTANDLTPIPVQGGSLMPFNLGYIDSTGGGFVSYPNRDIQFRIVQVEDGVVHETEDFAVEQRGDGTTWDASVGFNVYYQWGRKDPMIPAKDYGAVPMTHPLVGTREVYPDANYVHGTGYTVNVQGNYITGGYGDPSGINTPPDFASGIQRPYNAFLNTHNSGWVGGYDNGYYNAPGWGAPYTEEAFRLNSSIPVNLWNNGMYTTMDGTADKWKTVYDPCPPGFCVPTIGVFSQFTNETAIGEPTSDGRYFSIQGGGRIFFPFSGLRVFYNNNDGTAVLWAEAVRKGGYYWTDSTFGAVQNTNTENSYSKLWSFGITPGTVNTIVPITVNLDLNMRGVTEYTRGSSLAIRPMVDPKY